MTNKKTQHLTKTLVYDRLRTVIDPELHVDIVSLGLIYDASVSKVQTKDGARTIVHILMTLTTPGCPLADAFDRLVKESLENIPGLDPRRDVRVELTFDPPWLVDMIEPETRATLGL